MSRVPMTKSIDQYANYTDEQLLTALRQDDGLAFKAIYNRYIDVLYRAAYKRLQSKESADDILQEIFVRFYEKRNTLSPTLPIKPYLLTSLKNRILNEFRNRLIHASHHANIAATQDTSLSIYPTIDVKALEQRFRQTLTHIPEKCREVYELSRFEYLTNKSIAERLGISVNTVEKHIGKALAILRKEFSGQELVVLLLLLGENI
ncbi:RNA polymerase sigma-70 factor [Chitinophaga silvatica]|uniref:RNA polymerase sigma-70 factor n=1 Tax=Chitinophaga silvatica TaxID=2282649 RepID=A0A3E1Y2Q2_9BACT|nr:RNA polymerase sigma-70 factor [Chitinophaga silvatica]RFS18906.1 RNA polymerase sigma-70 factor [Chitinophaga silvatica]